MLGSISLRSLCPIVVFAVLAAPILQAQTPAKPAAQTKAPPKAPARPPARTAAPAPAPKATPPKPAEPAPPPKPVAEDLHYKASYANGGQRTESVTYLKGERERFEFADMVVLKQPDLKRTVQISRAANTYLVVPDGAASMPTPAPAVEGNTPPKAGVVTVTTTVTDTGERKTTFGVQARHVKTVLDRQPTPGACDQTKQHFETDGWYIDVPKALAARSAPDAAAPPAFGGCADEIKTAQSGDPKALGFPIAYTMTTTGDDGKPSVVTMEVSELEVTTLDAALFEVPSGLTEAGNIGALSKALSDAHEAKLAAETVAPSTPVDKKPGVVRIGVPEFTNKTTQQADTRALRDRLVADLVDAKIDAVPLPAASQSELLQHATERGYDYLLVADVTDLKVSKGGGIGGLVKAASKVTGGASAKDPTEAALAVKLIQPDGKARLSATAKGKDGGFDMKAGLGVAKFAGTMYMNMMTGKMMMNALNASMAGNLGGMGMLGNPSLMHMQTRSLGIGLDPTAGAASFLTQQAMSLESSMSGASGQQGPSFDAALRDALADAAKAVSENLKKADASKKK